MLSSHHPRGGVQPASGEGLEGVNCHLKNLSSEDLSSTDALKMCEGSELIYSGQKIIEITLPSVSEGPHFLCVCAQSRLTLWAPWTVATRLRCPWNFPGKNTGVGCHFQPHGIFPTQGSNRSLLHWQADSLPPCHLGFPIPNKGTCYLS